ncbi:flagellar biosynthesis protein FlhA [Thermodesulfovibrio yellowstonii]|uniref:Flagellar biosynthesis protein FlhA n=3 Tax=Thermodesulfovibrionaceae TaxID=2811504 RepID=B5YIY8_THEYD|nr:flagellar biosynthesis protein FlhA [Thermodesulfovibrio yellowstonii DSM 11347]GLI52504.1 flagellar biosynthesis protein FlhA [Thermodesulfovibrio islandicus]
MNIMNYIRSDVLVAVGIILILIFMIVPIPPFMLDLSLTMSITLSILIILVASYVRKPLDFSVFPSVLLIATLMRLSLNIASTRLILTRGELGTEAAGKVIKAFGEFVVSGNFVVGLIVFLILVIINFIVITKGAGRIAEVSARFTLDAMPGKQMSIDADLNAGLIDEKEARRRREEISREADFYGAMDGASKFIRGDAIAAIIIMIINIIGGILIGVLQKGMPIGDAVQTYVILTIGDGLAAQVPALITSTAAGIVVSRAATESNLGQDILQQLFKNPKTLATASGVLLLLGLIPGLPHLPFIIIAVVSGAIAYLMISKEKKEKEALPPPPVEEKPVSMEAQLESLLRVDPISLEIGYNLIPLVEGESSLVERIRSLRKQIAMEMGYIVPSIHIKDNLMLKPSQYSILIKGVEIATSEIILGRFLAIGARPGQDIDGIPTKDPAFGVDALWIEEKDVSKAQMLGFTVVDASSVIVTHLREVLKNYGYELLGKQETQRLLDNLAKTHPRVVDDLIPNLLTLSQVQKVLQNLLRERVSIKDLQTILETLSEYANVTKDPDILTEHVRQALSRRITKSVQNPDGSISAILFEPSLERTFIESLQTTPQGINFATDPLLMEKTIENVKKMADEATVKGYQPVLICSQSIRRFIKRAIERIAPSLPVLSPQEIAPGVKILMFGTVKLN